MKYISSFIHVPGDRGRTNSVDVTKIDNITGSDNEIKVYTTGCSCYLTVKMNKEKFIDMVENKRRELWEGEHETTKLKLQLLGQIVANTTPKKTIEGMMEDLDRMDKEIGS